MNDTLIDIVKVDPASDQLEPEFNLVAFLLPARGTVSQWVLITLILLFTGLFRWAVGFWGYSGYQKPPMHGDFEAQRHWMELTQHLPVSMWYFYDLPYWGLDYPPLTAYHSWICGKIGSLIEPAWFALRTSRGYESQGLKVFMRATVIISEYLVYVPAMIIFLRHYARANSNSPTGTSTMVALVAILMQPATMLIDHGHFQYNTVMLGFFVACLSSIYAGRYLWSCVFFVFSLGFKQMALYYAPVMFAFLLGSCFTPQVRFTRLILIAVTTLAAFAVLLAPLLIGTLYDVRRGTQLPYRAPPPFLAMRDIRIDSSSRVGALSLQLSQMIHRIFPFARGMFEDKVANFWCALHTVFKLQNFEPYIALPRLSGFATFMSILPSMSVIVGVPNPHLLPFAFASCAFGFFLFSFQVHEKSILLPLLPLTLLLGSKHGLSKSNRAWIGFANTLATWTLFPLLSKDGLRTPYTILTLLWCWLLGLPPLSVSCYHTTGAEMNTPTSPRDPDDLLTPTKIVHWWFYILMAFWHLLSAFAPPPASKPDLWSVVNACLGAAGFALCYAWATWNLILGSGLLDEYFVHSQKYLDDVQRKAEAKVAELVEKTDEVIESAAESVGVSASASETSETRKRKTAKGRK